MTFSFGKRSFFGGLSRQDAKEIQSRREEMISVYLSSLAFAAWAYVLLESIQAGGMFTPWFVAIALTMTLFRALYFACELKRLRHIERNGYFEPDSRQIRPKS